jgi:hypothetical protein
LLFILLAFVGFWYFLMSGGAELIVSEETTVITEPLKSDGKTVDFFQAIQKMTEPDIQADENGFRDVVLAFGRGIFEIDINNAGWQYLAMCETLGIDPLTPPVFLLENLRPDAIHFNDEGLNAVQAAIAKQHYFVPPVRRNEGDLVFSSQPLAAYSFHVPLTSQFQQRAMSRFSRENNLAGAWKDILTSIRLYRFVTIQAVWRNVLNGGKIDEMLATPVDEVVATLSQWTPEQLEQAMRDLESLPNWQDQQTTLTVIQFMLLDLISATNDLDGLRVNLPGEVREMMDVFRIIAFDWNLVAKELNREFRAYGKLMEQATGKSLDEQFELLRLRQPEETSATDIFRNQEKLNAKMQGLVQELIEVEGPAVLVASGRSKLTGAFAGNLLVSWAAGELYRLQLMEESRCQALRLALALERYHREHQKYPDSLDELRLKAMPMNVSLEYEKQDNGYRIQNKVMLLERP